MDFTDSDSSAVDEQATLERAAGTALYGASGSGGALLEHPSYLSPAAALKAVESESERILSWTGCWWVLHTRARNEKVVAAALERERVSHYLPTVAVRRSYAKSTARFDIPLFPGYVFMCGDHAGRDVARRTNRVANIIDVLDQERLREELAGICRVIESGQTVSLYPALRVGQRCRITSGALKGTEGMAIANGRRWRMHLAVTMLGQSAVIEVDAALLEAAN